MRTLGVCIFGSNMSLKVGSMKYFFERIDFHTNGGICFLLELSRGVDEKVIPQKCF